MKEKYLPFKKARDYIRKQNLKNTKEWKMWSKGTLKGKEKRPIFIPPHPDVIYKDKGWISWTDWLKEPIEYLSFEEARDFVRSLNLKTYSQWQLYYQGKLDGLSKPDNIPWNPEKIYKDKWNGIKDWIGSNWRDFYEAREFVRSLNLKGLIEWKLYCKNELKGYEPKPYDIPTDPKRVYGNQGYTDMADWLGTNRKRSNKDNTTWLEYEEAKKFIHTLKLNSYHEWKAYINNEISNLPIKPSNIPKSPQFVYKNKGWIDWNDWLGYEKNNISILITQEYILEFNSNIFLNDIISEYSNFKSLNKIINFFSSKKIKSIIESNLSEDEIKEIENLLFSFRTKPNKSTQTKKAFIGLIFLIYITYKLNDKITYKTLWSVIVEDLNKYASITTFFVNNYFINSNPNRYLIDAINLASKTFNLRNDFINKDEHQYLRNTILLQIGLLNNRYEFFNFWLSSYNQPLTISELLDINSENYSKSFNDGWRVLRRYRDNLLQMEQAKNILNNNVWYKHLDLDKLLSASKQKVKKQIVTTEDRELPIFYLEKINYSEDGLSFTINVQDTYSLNLSGFRYEIYIDNEYKGVLISNSSKELILEQPIVINNPEINQIDLEVKNEDGDIVYFTNIVLFDFSEQIVLFDEDGNIYYNIFKKLNATKKYHILIDSDLDCNFNKELQREYFDGYALLVPFITYKDDFKITYNNEFLFKLNFTEYIEKPNFIDNLVLYAVAETSFIIEKEYDFLLKIMNIDLSTGDISLENLPKEVKIIKWIYSGGYADNEDIKNENTIKTKLFSEMITAPKHTLLIKYKNRVFKKVVYCNFFEKQNQYRLFKIDNSGASYLVNKTDLLTKYDLKKYKYYLSYFGNIELFYVKNKSNFYKTIKPNKIINFEKLDGYGETIFLSEHLFNSSFTNIFNYCNNEKYINILKDNLNEINLKTDLPYFSKIVLLTQNFNELEMSYENIKSKIVNNKIEINEKIVSLLVLQGNNLIDSSCNIKFLDKIKNIDFTVLKYLFLSNYPFLLKKSYITLLREFILNNIEEFFNIFYNEKISINNNFIYINFLNINILIEHILFGIEFNKIESEKILKNIILRKQEKLLLETPIVLFKLLQSSKSQKLTSYIYNFVYKAKLKDERDEKFTNMIIESLFNTSSIKGIQKHNLKIAMHYINKDYYLKKALERLNV